MKQNENVPKSPSVNFVFKKEKCFFNGNYLHYFLALEEQFSGRKTLRKEHSLAVVSCYFGFLKRIHSNID